MPLPDERDPHTAAVTLATPNGSSVLASMWGFQQSRRPVSARSTVDVAEAVRSPWSNTNQSRVVPVTGAPSYNGKNRRIGSGTLDATWRDEPRAVDGTDLRDGPAHLDRVGNAPAGRPGRDPYDLSIEGVAASGAQCEGGNGRVVGAERRGGERWHGGRADGDRMAVPPAELWIDGKLDAENALCVAHGESERERTVRAHADRCGW